MKITTHQITVLITLALFLAFYNEHVTAKQPNIVLFIADDVSQDFSCYGGPVKTPNIDALAAKGVLFEDAYVTASSCSPSRNSIITGRYPHSHGAPELHMSLPENQFLFPTALRKCGYYSALSGKWHMGEATRPAFDLIDSANYETNFTGANNWLKILKNRPQDKPFFLWYSSFDAHRPWELDPLHPAHDPTELELPIGIPDTPLARADFASYCDEVRRFDYCIGQVIDELKSQGVFENTLIFVFADNGRPFPRSKTSLYDSGMRTPLIVHWPNGQIKNGTVSHSLVSLIDLAPTILEVANLPISHRLQGHSFLPILKNPKHHTRMTLFGERNWHVQRACGRMVRQGDWVYIRDFTPTLYSFQMVNHLDPTYAELLRLKSEGKLTQAEAEAFSTNRASESLFNIANDPNQIKNLIADPKYKEKLQVLRSELNDWQIRTGDSIPKQDQMTPDRHDRMNYEKIFPGRRPPTGIVPGQAAKALDL